MPAKKHLLTANHPYLESSYVRTVMPIVGFVDHPLRGYSRNLFVIRCVGTACIWTGRKNEGAMVLGIRVEG